MFTIKKVSEITGIPAPTIRSWELRHGIGLTTRSPSGYRIYDDNSLNQITQMKRLVDSGWTPSEAAKSILESAYLVNPVQASSSSAYGAEIGELMIQAAKELNATKVAKALDLGFSLGSFEYVLDTWLFPAMRVIGREWEEGRMSIAAEHLLSSAIMRRLANSFDGSGFGSGHLKVLVGTPAGSFHEIGLIASATAMRRVGLGVVYLGTNVPLETWVESVVSHAPLAVVIAVSTQADVVGAQQIVSSLTKLPKAPYVAVGGPWAGQVAGSDLVLSGGIGESINQFFYSVTQRLESR